MPLAQRSQIKRNMISERSRPPASAKTNLPPRAALLRRGKLQLTIKVLRPRQFIQVLPPSLIAHQASSPMGWVLASRKPTMFMIKAHLQQLPPTIMTPLTTVRREYLLEETRHRRPRFALRAVRTPLQTILTTKQAKLSKLRIPTVTPLLIPSRTASLPVRAPLLAALMRCSQK